jgi:hypothetical protein
LHGDSPNAFSAEAGLEVQVSRSASARFFVRDDDVGELTDSFRGFAETFAARRIPVSYQIIPAQLTPACASYLVELRRAHPRLVEFGQHGLHHRMLAKGRELKREFGPERTLSAQTAIIEEGLTILRQALGEDPPIEVFTPPQHKFNGDTVRAAARAGHRVFSVSAYPTTHHRFAYAFGRRLGLSSFGHQGVSYHAGPRPEADIVEMSIGLDVDDGKTIKRSAAELDDAMEVVARRTPYAGAMYHHALYADSESRAELAHMADRLVGRGVERFALLGDLARSTEAGSTRA